MWVDMGKCEQHIGFCNSADQFTFYRFVDHRQAFAIQAGKFLQCFQERSMGGASQHAAQNHQGVGGGSYEEPLCQPARF